MFDSPCGIRSHCFNGQATLVRRAKKRCVGRRFVSLCHAAAGSVVTLLCNYTRPERLEGATVSSEQQRATPGVSVLCQTHVTISAPRQQRVRATPQTHDDPISQAGCTVNTFTCKCTALHMMGCQTEYSHSVSCIFFVSFFLYAPQ